MTDERKEEKNKKLTKSVIIVFLGMAVGISLVVIAEFIQVEFSGRNMPISLTEPSLNDQCWELLQEQTEFKNYLGFGVKVTPEQLDGLSFSDYEYYMELEGKLQDLLCY